MAPMSPAAHQKFMPRVSVDWRVAPHRAFFKAANQQENSRPIRCVSESHGAVKRDRAEV